MKVKLLAYTPDPEKIIAIAARVCYSTKADIDSIAEGFTEEKIEKFIEQLLQSQHVSTTEHCSFSFGIEGISRVVSHELCRHRIGIAISQRSQRYCLEDAYDFITPSDIEYENEEEYASEIFNQVQTYKNLVSRGVAKESARYVLPNAMPTRMVVTMNARELLHFFALRCCSRAQPEMRQLANEMVKLVKPIAPTLFKKAGPSCVQFGFCPEGDRCCGRCPTIDQLRQAYYKSGKDCI